MVKIEWKTLSKKEKNLLVHTRFWHYNEYVDPIADYVSDIREAFKIFDRCYDASIQNQLVKGTPEEDYEDTFEETTICIADQKYRWMSCGYREYPEIICILALRAKGVPIDHA